MSLLKKSSSGNTVYWTTDSAEPEYTFTILQSYILGSFVLLWLHYPEASKFDGAKILLFEGLSIDYLMHQVRLDPHFIPEETGLVARFRPTRRGWDYALTLVNELYYEEADNG